MPFIGMSALNALLDPDRHGGRELRPSQPCADEHRHSIVPKTHADYKPLQRQVDEAAALGRVLTMEMDGGEGRLEFWPWPTYSKRARPCKASSLKGVCKDGDNALPHCLCARHRHVPRSASTARIMRTDDGEIALCHCDPPMCPYKVNLVLVYAMMWQEWTALDKAREALKAASSSVRAGKKRWISVLTPHSSPRRSPRRASAAAYDVDDSDDSSLPAESSAAHISSAREKADGRLIRRAYTVGLTAEEDARLKDLTELCTKCNRFIEKKTTLPAHIQRNDCQL